MNTIINQLNITFGTKNLLNQYITNYPNRLFKLIQSNIDPDKAQYQLIDISNRSTVFKNGISYNIIKSTKNQEFRGLFHFMFFKLNDDQIKIFKSLNDLYIFNSNNHSFLQAMLLNNNTITNEYVLLTTWATDHELSNWQTSNDYQNIYHSLTNPIDPVYSKVYYPTI